MNDSEHGMTIVKESELLMLNSLIMESKFSLISSDSRMNASPISAELASRLLDTLVRLQSETDPYKIESWKNWLEKKKEWIWSRSLSIMIKNKPFQWDEMTKSRRFEYISWLFSPYKLADHEKILFIKEYEEYLKTIELNSSINLKQDYGTATEQMISKLEIEMGFRLPEDYRVFLSQYNGGTPIVHLSLVIVEELNEAIPLEAFYGIHQNKRYDLAHWNLVEYEGEIPEKFIVIGEVAEGGKILLKISGNGGVFYWDANEEFDEEFIYNVGLNFRVFIKNLKKMIKKF
ncbi:SMI1/KNR4 family protein [Paenibacillus xylanexedens]|uniref:SMI1/KNR4 family protein n=1 Tax=Paenibacillus xylanexedens TaxID=528191 RepID=UPI003CFCFA7F